MTRKIALFFICIALLINGIGFAKPNTSIKAVVFDFGGVVAAVDRTQATKFLKSTFHLSDEEFKLLLNKWKICLVEGCNEEQFWKSYADSLQVTLPPDWFTQFEKVKAFAFTEIPQTIAIVKELKKQGYRVAMLSNVTAYHAEVIRKLGYYDLFDPVLLSYEIGVEKPDPKAYQILLKKLKLPASAIIFIDDREENVEAAEKMGIASILFVRPEELQRELKKKGVDINRS